MYINVSSGVNAGVVCVTTPQILDLRPIPISGEKKVYKPDRTGVPPARPPPSFQTRLTPPNVALLGG